MANTYVTGVDGFSANTPRYNDLVNKVYDWSNRDIAALPAQIIRDSLRYAADTAYRTLRVPPLEATIVWTDFPRTVRIDTTTNDVITQGTTTQVVVNQEALDAILAEIATFNEDATNVGTMQFLTTTVQGPLTLNSEGQSNIYQSITYLSIPIDLIEFIQIRGTDTNGLSTRVFNEKADIRTFQDVFADTYNNAGFWARQGNNVLLTPSFGNASTGFYGGGAGPETSIEMYYYRRLPALNAQFDNTFNNWMSGFGAFSTGEVYDSGMTVAANRERYMSITGTWTGVEAPQWLRDENEKVPLMGALAECFAYLQEDDQAQKYLQLFQKEIAELNDEDKMRDASGGNIQMHYNGRGLI